MPYYQIRKIELIDNFPLANIIRQALDEFGVPHAGTVYDDESTDRLSEVFEMPGSWYFVLEKNGAIYGGGGIYPTNGLAKGVCELVKFYLSPAARGGGWGKTLLEACFSKAKELGYSKIYLETMPELKAAIPLYEKQGFKFLDGPLGCSGHFGCSLHMMKELE